MSYLSDFCFPFGAARCISWIPLVEAVSKMWFVLQSLPHWALCIPLANTRVGFRDINFKLFTSTDVWKTCRNKTKLIFVSLWTSGCWAGGVSLAWPIPPGAAVRQQCLEPARKPRDRQAPNSWLIQIKRQRKLQPAPCDLTKPLQVIKEALMNHEQSPKYQRAIWLCRILYLLRYRFLWCDRITASIWKEKGRKLRSQATEIKVIQREVAQQHAASFASPRAWSLPTDLSAQHRGAVGSLPALSTVVSITQQALLVAPQKWHFGRKESAWGKITM